MTTLETAGKGTLFGIAISCITAGIKFIEVDFQVGVVLLIVGVALMIVWAYLVERQARKAGEQAAKRAWKEMMKGEGKRSFKGN